MKFWNPYHSPGLLQQTKMISSADHHDPPAVRQAQAHQIFGQRKSGPMQPVGWVGWGCGHTHHNPLHTGHLRYLISRFNTKVASLEITRIKTRR